MELQQQYEELLHAINHNEATEEAIEEVIGQAEKEYQKEVNTCVSFNHIVEAYYYEYYISKESYMQVELNIGLLYRTLAKMYEQSNKLRKAETAYNRAYRWNPVDLDTIYGLIEFHKRDGELDKVYNYTKKSYNYCCTRADIAHYYRNLAFYYLESYNPEAAEVLYEYSQCFYQTDQAENELIYIEKALNRKRKGYSVTELQKKLGEYKIPIQAKETTVALTYRVGKMLLESGHMDSARDCFLMVYDLTQDDEIKAILTRI